ncbi:hypothetical protein EV368DRAFT_90231, partial [Lentinula lateritia]
HLLSPTLAEQIRLQHGSLAQLKSSVSAAATGLFTSGFVWLVTDAAGNIAVVPTFGPGSVLVRSQMYMAHVKGLGAAGRGNGAAGQGNGGNGKGDAGGIGRESGGGGVGEGPDVGVGAVLRAAYGRGDPLGVEDPYFGEWVGELEQFQTDAGTTSPSTDTTEPDSSHDSHHYLPHPTAFASLTSDTPSSSPFPSSSSPSPLSSSPSLASRPRTLPHGAALTLAAAGDTLYPLFCLSVHEHAWLSAGCGVWGRERWVQAFWDVLDWERVSAAYEYFRVR